ncbi:Prolyl oligopeptidase family protein [Chitinophaga sp. YR573]|uniref:alpha/beta hydrolase family protein n=1 Tax=Chitinophaga sp. YR573 TaxID=1881040 RepID=UPI0008CD2F90|nr:prolyl oligopeptidase family serine peptidase [Chitinophaga sp. YR573]SEW26040.1 Prolyl oligopeptidase family protein [Chitinophaga sp. YR573]
MKQIPSVLILILSFQLSFAQNAYTQKPLVNDTSYLSWTTVENGTISANGQYAFYRIANEPIGGNTWVILSTDKQWEVRSTKYNNLNFSPDSKYLYAIQGDSLVKLKLHSTEVTTIPHCKGYELYSYATTNWLVYTLDAAASSLIAEDLRTGLKRTLNNVQEYSINRDGGAIVCKIKTETPGIETMQWTDLSTGRSLIIYKGTPSKNLIYNPSGTRMAFDTTNDKGQTEIRCYQRDWKESKLIASDTSAGIAENLKITTNRIWRFSADGQDLFFNLAAKPVEPAPKKTGPDIWNYKDLYLLSELKKRGNYWHDDDNLTILNIKTKQVKQILSGNQIPYFGLETKENTDVFIVQSSTASLEDLVWDNMGHISYYLCFAKTGALIPIKKNCTRPIYVMSLSPDNNFLLYFDPELLKYISYDVKKGKSEMISRNLEKELQAVQYVVRPSPQAPNGTFGIVGWLKGTNKVIVHGMYDLWELDLEDTTAPRNITNGIGDKNHLIFANLNKKILDKNKPWMLKAFNMYTKEEEIYSLNYSSGKLTFLFKTASALASSPTDSPRNLKKAGQTSAYLIKLGNSQTSPNFVYTTDFKKLDTLSHSFPEKKYNWLSSELATYHDQFGRECQGIVYKPENFDPKKKYPVIFYYYLEMVNGLNKPLDIEPSNIGLNVPVLVSNGYIVCMPNIYLDVNKPGESALMSVNAAADYLKQFAWIDSTRMGIKGHSRGGYETDYIVTHSARFAAAVSGAGMSNLIEYTNSLNGELGGLNHGYVRATMLMNAGIADNSRIYNDNSPMLAVKNITTPLLLMHNDGDQTVSVSQSIEMFVQLRSQQKRVWLLQYDGERHVINKTENQIDYQNKVKDFFDHYLKNQPMANWMKNSIK